MHRNEVPHVGAQMRERMKFIIESGWLVPVRRLFLVNYDERPDGAAVELLVIHGISLPPGEFGGPWIDALFTNRLDPAAHSYFRENCSLRVRARSCSVIPPSTSRISSATATSRPAARPIPAPVSIGRAIERC